MSENTTADQGAQLLAAVARLNRWATRHADFDTPPAQARLLSLIESMGKARIGELAEADHCSQPTMTTQVQRIEAEGWVQRSTDKADARVALIELTPAGREVINTVRAARIAVIAPALESLSAQDREALVRATGVIEELLHQA